jgi:HSP20 family molecular chaperone IbpA
LLGRFLKGHPMTRLTLPSYPMLLGFEELERTIERTAKASGDGYPPYNIERLAAGADTGEQERLRITLAVAGFTREQLHIELTDKQLTVRGKQADEPARTYLHRGIGARQFCRSFVLADGLEVHSADLNNGLLSIDLIRVVPTPTVRTIEIGHKKPEA